MLTLSLLINFNRNILLIAPFVPRKFQENSLIKLFIENLNSTQWKTDHELVAKFEKFDEQSLNSNLYQLKWNKSNYSVEFNRPKLMIPFKWKTTEEKSLYLQCIAIYFGTTILKIDFKLLVIFVKSVMQMINEIL